MNNKETTPKNFITSRFEDEELKDNETVQLVQSVTLTPSAYSVIIRDKSIYSSAFQKKNDKEVTMSAFLTRIFISAYKASVNFDINKYNGIPLLKSFVFWQMKEIDKMKENNTLSSKEADAVKKYKIADLINKHSTTKTPNATRVRLNINGQLFRTLNSINDDLKYENKVYDSKLRKFFKAVFEEYAELPDYQRERLVYAERVIAINKVIIENKKSYNKWLNAVSTMYDEEENVRIVPYKIIEDEYKMYNYLICLTDEKCDEGNFKPISYRLSRIKPDETGNQLSEKEIKNITKDQYPESLNDELMKDVKLLLKKPRYGLESGESKVLLTEEGVKKFNRILYNRPIIKNNEKARQGENTFVSPPIQVKYYFSRFGKDGVILEPKQLLKQMRKAYNDGANAYNDECEKRKNK